MFLTRLTSGTRRKWLIFHGVCCSPAFENLQWRTWVSRGFAYTQRTWIKTESYRHWHIANMAITTRRVTRIRLYRLPGWKKFLISSRTPALNSRYLFTITRFWVKLCILSLKHFKLHRCFSQHRPAENDYVSQTITWHRLYDANTANQSSGVHFAGRWWGQTDRWTLDIHQIFII